MEDGYCYKEATSSSTFLTLCAVFDIQDWGDDSIRDSIRDCFVTGKWDPEDQKEGVDIDDEEAENENGSDNEGSDDDDYEDMLDGDEKKEDESKKKSEETEEQAAERRRQMKERLKKQFDAEYDEIKEPYNALKAELDEQSKVRF